MTLEEFDKIWAVAAKEATQLGDFKARVYRLLKEQGAPAASGREESDGTIHISAGSNLGAGPSVGERDSSGPEQVSGAAAPRPELAPTTQGWADETMRMINALTPDIKDKASDPDWFLLRKRLEEREAPPDLSGLERLASEVSSYPCTVQHEEDPVAHALIPKPLMDRLRTALAQLRGAKE